MILLFQIFRLLAMETTAQNNNRAVSAFLAIALTWIFWSVLSPVFMLLYTFSFMLVNLAILLVWNVGENILFTISLACLALFMSDILGWFGTLNASGDEEIFESGKTEIEEIIDDEIEEVIETNELENGEDGSGDEAQSCGEGSMLVKTAEMPPDIEVMKLHDQDSCVPVLDGSRNDLTPHAC